MSSLSPALAERIAAEHASAVGALNATAGGVRRAALDALLAAGLPTSRDENWKYANLRPLEKLRYRPASAAAGAAAAPVPAACLPPALGDYTRYVFVDGVLDPALSAPLEAGGAMITLQEAAPDAAAIVSPDERFALLNAAFTSQTFGIEVAAGSAHLELVFVARAESADGASYPRVRVRVGPGARLTLIEQHLSAAEAASFVNSAVRVAVGAGARLTHYRLQHLSARSIHFDTLGATLGHESAYRLHTTATGGQSARSTVKARLEGERAELSLAVAALGDRQQVQDAYAVVEHAAANARTEQTFRGIAAGRSRVAFNGKIIVAPLAHGTDSRQSLRGLLAGPGAEIDVRPQLEIYTDDVRCSHGATAGKLDDHMLFYLLSRGLTREAAQRLLKWAFLGDVVARVEPPQLRRQIETRLVGQLHDAALQELL